MTSLRTTLFALGFASLGALGAVGLQAAAGRTATGARDGAPIAQPVAGAPGMGGPAMGRGPGMGRGNLHAGRAGGGIRVLMGAMSQLDLTAKQQQELDQVRTDLQQHARTSRQAMSADRQALVEAVENGTLTRPMVQQSIQTHMQQAEETMSYAADRMMDAYEMLDSDQKSQLGQAIIQARQQRREQGGRRGMGPGARGGLRGMGPGGQGGPGGTDSGAQ